MNDFIQGWKAGIKMVLKDVERFSTFSEGDEIDYDNKNNELPITVKELNKMLFLAFRKGQKFSAKSIIDSVKYHDFTQYLEK